MFISTAEKQEIFSTLAILKARIADLEKKPVKEKIKPKTKTKRNLSPEHREAIRLAAVKRFAEKKAQQIAVGGTE